MQLNVMPLSELLTTANNYAASIKELGIYSDLVKELCNRLDAGSLARREITKQRDAMAAENAALKAAIKDVTDSAEEVEYEDYFTFVVNPDAVHSGVDLIEGETPATDAFLREVRASVIPEGYALVPQQIFLDPSDIESICSQCGDGHESGYGDFTDGLLWVGDIQRDDGSIVHGLHISSADYSEEGGVTVCEFADQLRQGGAA